MAAQHPYILSKVSLENSGITISFFMDEMAQTSESFVNVGWNHQNGMNVSMFGWKFAMPSICCFITPLMQKSNTVLYGVIWF